MCPPPRLLPAYTTRSHGAAICHHEKVGGRNVIKWPFKSPFPSPPPFAQVTHLRCWTQSHGVQYIPCEKLVVRGGHSYLPPKEGRTNAPASSSFRRLID